MIGMFAGSLLPGGHCGEGEAAELRGMLQRGETSYCQPPGRDVILT